MEPPAEPSGHEGAGNRRAVPRTSVGRGPPRPVRRLHRRVTHGPNGAAAPATPPELIRNFCIIAHIDHGKSTLADRMLQLTGVVDARAMRAQYLDRMDIERERGITIKSQAVRLPWPSCDGTTYALNLIDTPGHVDFTYEVSRSLAACEGAVLLVDAAQGIEAQTLANLYLAMENDLHDHPGAQQDRPAGRPAGEVRRRDGPPHRLRPGGRACGSRGKTGEGVERPARRRSCASVPAPDRRPGRPARAMIFDSVYDTYRGVVTYVRVIDGDLNPRERIVDDVDAGDPRAARDRRHLAGAGARRRVSGSARSATSSPASRTSASPGSATP